MQRRSLFMGWLGTSEQKTAAAPIWCASTSSSTSGVIRDAFPVSLLLEQKSVRGVALVLVVETIVSVALLRMANQFVSQAVGISRGLSHRRWGGLAGHFCGGPYRYHEVREDPALGSLISAGCLYSIRYIGRNCQYGSQRGRYDAHRHHALLRPDRWDNCGCAGG